ncbi:MAG TPA: hypothetical protein VL976_13250, partial [Xanthobacteraceae bacterium]|nr:hypothetical protein [Xanthobacteraceae bacterium]
RSDAMLLNISQVGQIALPVLDVDRAEAFFEKLLGLRKLYRFGNLTFFDCAGVRLLLEKDQPSGNRDPYRLHLFSPRRYRARGCRAEKTRPCLRLYAASDRQDGRSRFVDGLLPRPRRPYLGCDAGGAERIYAAKGCGLVR